MSTSTDPSGHVRPDGRPGHNRGRKLPPEILTPSEVKELLGAFNRGATGARNRALVAVMYRAGLRAAEALALRPADVDVDAGTIRVLHGKGDRARTVGVDDGALALVERWITARTKLGLNGRQPLFCKLDGKPWSQQAAREALYYAARKAGIDKRVHPHGLRHAHAAELCREGTNIRLIQQQLGHASLAVTDHYLRSINPEEAIEAIRAREWEV